MTIEQLKQRASGRRRQNIRELLTSERDRSQRFTIEAAGLYLDFTRSICSAADLDALLGFAQGAQVAKRRDAMLNGEPINQTENRPALHTALRMPSTASLPVAGIDVVAPVHQVLDRIARFSERVRSGQWRGADGNTITDVVNIGIGGSQLGPELACDALREFGQPGLRLHFLASLDPMAWHRIASGLNPSKTLVIVASKSWKTLETIQNAYAVRDWMLQQGIARASLHRHFVAVSTHVAAATEFGIAAENVFPFWDWVGGRYSVWSAIGLPVMLQVGAAAFGQMLAGAHAMDQHFAQAPLARNAPVLQALIAWWQSMVLGNRSEAVVPYSDGLRRLPAFLQQLTMESNGKSTARDGKPVLCATAPVLWGEPGTDSQHSFFQFLHQGTDPVPVEFVLPLPQRDPAHERDIALVANCLAQSDALLDGRSLGDTLASLRTQGLDDARAKQLAPHMVYPGNRPTSLVLLQKLDPTSLGALLALYEHRTAVQGFLWDINSFDQWGVEVGKLRATSIQPLLQSADAQVINHLDPCSKSLMLKIREGLAGRQGKLPDV